mgnify:CR=1 FL=1
MNPKIVWGLIIAVLLIAPMYLLPAKTDEKIVTCPDGREMFHTKYPVVDCTGDLGVPEDKKIGLWDTTTWNSFDFIRMTITYMLQMLLIFGLEGFIFGGITGLLWKQGVENSKRKAMQ